MTQAGASASRRRTAQTWGVQDWEDSPLRDVSAPRDPRGYARARRMAKGAEAPHARPSDTATLPSGRPDLRPSARAPARLRAIDGGVPGRRTVTITGHGSERATARPSPRPARRRPAQRRHERPGFRPDRIGLYAVLLGALLILVAASSSHAAIRAGHAVRTSEGAIAGARIQPASVGTPGAARGHR